MDSGSPKFIQVADSVAAEILNGKMKIGQKLPSINELSSKNSISRDTAEKAYKILRDQKLIVSVTGSGNFVSYAGSNAKFDVFFLINKPCSYKMEVYNSFVNTIGNKGHVNMYLYYCDEQLFISALKKNINNYNYFVIMPHFRNSKKKHVNYTNRVLKAIETIPKDKLLILDNSYEEVTGNFTAIYQDFKHDIIYALNEALIKLKNYKKIILVYETLALFPYPIGLVHGFKEFCQNHLMDFEIIEEINNDLEFESKEAYIIIDDNDLVNLVQQIKKKNRILGTDVGVISYNETPLKALLDISVLSTDFNAMGQKAAELILTNKKEVFKNPFGYIERSSL
ncbi:GntR family transcriptional regulator [Flavobacterium piscis]|uniref:DNA-binding transcriptional regulator YhcF (GntR family) n=1 Tax=Flavobacterium piscis TaxID=1114874 RepID=A0ABU1YDN6_9FLAO|nr:GntR family transcriptional regulator [Flavobacterium piscis]MDR7212278.1 DNA-binding transcriptional regulator YhcF (GntR family) [Flavobacterium piscis]